MKFDGVTFNSYEASNMPEKDFVAHHLNSEGLKQGWRMKTEAEREASLKEVHAMAVAKHAAKTPKQDGNTGANVGKVSESKSKTAIPAGDSSNSSASGTAK